VSNWRPAPPWRWSVIAGFGNSVVFALFHGIDIALPSALVVGIIAAEMMRRSGSIWPAVPQLLAGAGTNPVGRCHGV
jgi:membrane protease YdiL (CAAX protease family)